MFETLIGLGIMFSANVNGQHLAIIGFILDVVIGVPMWSMTQRRLNDTGMNPKYADILMWILVIMMLIGPMIPILDAASFAFMAVITVICMFRTNHFRGD